jgi:hypothetical protein
MSNLINEFFDFNGPCPDNIPNCQGLREQYQKDIQTVRNANCRPCAETKIKVKYMEIVWNAFMETLS